MGRKEKREEVGAKKVKQGKEKTAGEVERKKKGSVSNFFPSLLGTKKKAPLLLSYLPR